MRETLHSLAEPIRKKIPRNADVYPYMKYLLSVELMAVAYSQQQVKVSLKEAWTLLTGYDAPILPENYSKKFIEKLRMLLPNFSAEGSWLEALEIYQELDATYRLLEIDEEGYFTFKTPNLDPNRKEFYEEILRKAIPYKESDKLFAGAGKFSYHKPSLDSKKVMTGEIPQAWLKETKRLPVYREKKEISFKLDFNWIDIAREMDEKLGKKHWEKTFKPIEFRAIGEDKEFIYDGLQHIVGGLASGKSSFQKLNTYWLVKHKGARVGLIVNSVTDLLELVSELEELGIKVAPIIGRSNRSQHLQKELIKGDYYTMDSLVDSKLASLSGICSIKALAKDFDYEERTYYPCEWLYSGSQTAKLCPLISTCGVYQDWTKLLDADVWVTTAAAVLSTKIPATIDPYKRTLYEAMYDLLDVIFVDEADQVQQRFEEEFIQEEDAFGRPFYLVGRLEEHYYEKIRSNTNHIGNPLIEEWRANLNHLSETSHLLMGVIKKSKRIRCLFRRNVIYLNFFIHHLVRKISVDEDHKEALRKRFINFSQSVDYGSSRVTEKSLQSIIRERRELEQERIIKDWLREVGGKLPEEKEALEKLLLDMKVFVYLANIEAALKYVKYKHSSIQQPSSLEQFSLLSMSKDFRPITKEAMTGVMFGYRYDQKSGEELGSIKILQYLAIGKDLLFKWPTIFEGIDHRKGPAVLLLSGTSYAPKSLHYHLESKPQWIISSIRQTSKLEQRFLPIRNPDDHEEIINISGVRDDGKRANNLRQMVFGLYREIEGELSYWRNQGENRKVLLVVNSYDDLAIVGEALGAIEQFQGRYRLLTRGDKRDEIHYPRTLIELFPREGADILVAPLMSISRGYNIMEGDRAYFGSAFYLIRPYPVPNDLSYFVRVLHGNLPLYLDEIEAENWQFLEGMRYLRKRSRGAFEAMYRKPGFWSTLSEKEREVLSWYTLIPVWQLNGRLLRHGSDARVFYCDGRFGSSSKGQASLLDYWQRIMEETEDEIFKQLYGPFKESIGKVKGEVVTSD